MKHSVRRNSIVTLTLLPALLLTLLLSGCMANSTDPNPQQPLKIAVDSEEYYNFAYRTFIEGVYPDQQIELIELVPDEKGTPPEEYIRKVREEKPDLILTAIWRYGALVEEGLLADLSPQLTAGSSMEETDLYPGMIEWMKQDGNGILYGLAPEFSSQILYYNADLFAKYGVAPPTDGMTLEEIYKLATRFTEAGGRKDGTVGLHRQYSNMPYSVLSAFAESEGLRMYDSRQGITMNTPGWRDLLQKVIQLYKNETLSLKAPKVTKMEADGITIYNYEDDGSGDLFGHGKAAMTIMRYTADSNNWPFKVGAVAPPVSEQDRSRSNGIFVNKVMAIGAEVDNAAAAWQMIELMTSERIAKIKAKNTRSGFSVHRTYPQYRKDPLVERLFKLMPVHLPPDRGEGVHDSNFYYDFEALINREITAAVQQNKPLDDVVSAIQKEGQAMLEAASRTE
ncbi:ABC transporter substrate-binding protein [Paenibacillus sp. GCM10027626]|uniref:ABC transporter substrate-binding protein n=1 Tax=Paenibacillus sp. GCM10027626 TaxID=3273411 RepID=UPI0036377885